MFELSSDQILRHLRRANELAVRSVKFGHHPFGAVIVAPDNETVLFEHGNIDTLKHAEARVIASAWDNLSPEYLWNCTLYTSVEPCAMCAGSFYWANLGRLVYGISEARLRELTGDNPQNPTLSLPCRSVLSTGQKNIVVIGPVVELEEEILSLHRSFWTTESFQ